MVLLGVTLIRSLSKTTIIALLVSQAFVLLQDRFSISRRTKVVTVLGALFVVLVFWSLLSSYYDVYINAGNQSESLTGRSRPVGCLPGRNRAAAVDRPRLPFCLEGDTAAWSRAVSEASATPTMNSCSSCMPTESSGVIMLVGLYGSFLRQVRRMERGSMRTFFLSLLLFVAIRGLADTEPFDLSLPLWAIILFSTLVRGLPAGAPREFRQSAFAATDDRLSGAIQPGRPLGRIRSFVTNLAELKNDWEHLAERDALWAILTDNRKVGGKWEVDEFMATGVAEIDTVLRHLRRIRQVPDPNGAVLDFGCGVGRLTQALAPSLCLLCRRGYFWSRWIEKAEALNRHLHCRYVVNAEEKLPFADGTFSFIYSNIVLQHVPPRFAEGYLREFVRLLAPGGVLVFGVQDSCAGVSSVMVRVRQIVRLRSRIKSALGMSVGNMQMNCLPESAVRRAIGAAKVVDVQFTNSAAKDFNGRLDYLSQPPTSGYIGKQYCVVKER